MGANTFSVSERATTAAEAFKIAVATAQHKHGHGGYTGTIAEKTSFVMVAVPPGREAAEFARSEEALDLVDDKWGPAGCVQIGKGHWLFFGWASS